MKPRTQWYALRGITTGVPVIFDTYQEACENAEPDEAVYLVRVENVRCVKKSQRIQPKHPLPPAAA